MPSTDYWSNGDKITAEQLNEIEDCISPEFFTIYDQDGTLSQPYYAIQDAFTNGKICVVNINSGYALVQRIQKIGDNTYKVITIQNTYVTSSLTGNPITDGGIVV